ncbi:hypothetical protein HH212_13670 [Massilia forsythiae]|uniref:Uncharacterized protein n=1 Tax=Massilia forsythiae TaxID=2728020 RepID=A0A7Z2VXJ4_9BURK|nr:hypothetical protein [Massilia forsythiae]QJE00944.1 hypothetical protein HH212_13670 [Massilia forsythiae]
MNDRLISDELVKAVGQQVIETLPWASDVVSFELQDDFQFLLVSVECDPALAHTLEQRRHLGHVIDDMMPTRDGELTWMLNFMMHGEVMDSYFGGDASMPELGF